MTQELLDKLRNGTADMVDKVMIVSRVGNYVKQVDELKNNFAEVLMKLNEEYADEAKMSGVACVMGFSVPSFLVSDNIEGGNESKTVTRIVFGSGERIKKILFEIANDMANGKTRESELKKKLTKKEKQL